MIMKKCMIILLVVPLLAFLSCSCAKNEDSNRQQTDNVKTTSFTKVAGEVVGPVEIPRSEISTKYGWDGSTWLKPAGDKYHLQLLNKLNKISYTLPKEGTLAVRFQKVGDGCSFLGSNIQIGNLVFEGSFTWSDEKITLEKGSTLRRVQ